MTQKPAEDEAAAADRYGDQGRGHLEQADMFFRPRKYRRQCAVHRAPRCLGFRDMSTARYHYQAGWFAVMVPRRQRIARSVRGARQVERTALTARVLLGW